MTEPNPIQEAIDEINKPWPELEPEAKPSLREKLSKVAAHCAYVQKDGQHPHYKYATAATIFVKVGEALEANRLVSVPAFRIADKSTILDSKDRPGTVVTMECRLEIHDLDSPEVIWTTAFGSGADWGDKAIMKAQTAALKYVWIMLLNISTGDDPEADSTTDSRASGEPVKPRQTPEQYQAKVERNKAAKLSPLGEKALELANEEADLSPALKASLAKIKEAKTHQITDDGARYIGGHEPPSTGFVKGGKPWPPSKEEIQAAMGPTDDEERCWCDAPILTLHTSKAKGLKAYTVCELSDLAFKKDRHAVEKLANLEEENPGRKHHWKWVK